MGWKLRKKVKRGWKKKSGFQIDHAGLQRKNICFRSKNVGLQSEKKRLKLDLYVWSPAGNSNVSSLLSRTWTKNVN